MAHPSESVLISGSGGFTGARLAAALISKGFKVSGFSRYSTAPWEYEVDLVDELAVRKAVNDIQPEIVFHLAGISSPAHASASEIYKSNVLGTQSFLSALAEAPTKPRLVVVASSAAVYSSPEDGSSLSETSLLAPVNHYGVSKLAAEGIARVFSKRLNVRTVRPFNYTGPGQSEQFLIPKIVNHFVRGDEVIELGNLNLWRDVSSVRDVIEAYLRIINKGDINGPLNICSGVGIHLETIIESLKTISGKSITVKINPNYMRSGEPARLVGSREILDTEIGTWNRQSMHELLSEMYEAAIKTYK